MQVFASKMVGMDCTSASVRTETVSELILGMVLTDAEIVRKQRKPRVPAQSQVGTTCATGPRYSPDHILINIVYIRISRANGLHLVLRLTTTQHS